MPATRMPPCNSPHASCSWETQMEHDGGIWLDKHPTVGYFRAPGGLTHSCFGRMEESKQYLQNKFCSRMPQDFHGFPYPKAFAELMPWKKGFHLNSVEPIGAHSEKAFTLPNFWDWSPWLILYFSVVANVVIDQKVPRHVHQVLVSLSWMVGNMKTYWLLKTIILYSNVFKPVRCEMPQIWSPHYSPGMVFSPDGGGAGRTKKSAFVSSIEIGSDTGLFPAFCRAAMASETMAQQESGEHVVAAWGLMRAGSSPAAVRKTLMRKMRTNWTVRLISPYVPYVYGFTIIHIVSLLVNHMCICFLCFPWPCLRREQNPSTQEQDALLPDDEELLQSKMERARRYQRNLST